ncbi:hypothetical protein [Methylorubrum suomiense]|uniref:hypothetical protein n=1 Tax=Methylorubrum suomiense TaxID=144191 RepID=UPI001AEE6353|nr:MULTISPECIES: hypothetical protein [Methylobacteriaceae]
MTAKLDGKTHRASLSDGYAVDLSATVEASAFVGSVLGKKDSAPATSRSASRTAILAGAGGEGVSAPGHLVEAEPDGHAVVMVGHEVAGTGSPNAEYSGPGNQGSDRAHDGSASESGSRRRVPF